MIRAVIFDLDGLLVDSEPVWFGVREEMFGRYGLQWTDDDQKALMGRSTQSWIDYVHDKLGGQLTHEAVKEETLKLMEGYYRSGEVPQMAGAGEALRACAARYTVGLASGSPPVLIEAALDANGWRAYFREVLSSDELQRGKPAPDPYLEMMKRLRVLPEETVVIEDSGSGIISGKASGAFVIAVPNPQLLPAPEALALADATLDSLRTLAARLGQGFS